jgi:Zn finger protein HypA/HybF involved in hydrogenase expression
MRELVRDAQFCSRSYFADKIGMHDFLLAKEITNELEKIIQEKGLNKPKKVRIEIGSVVLSHDNMPEHTEDINIENLKFGLDSIAKNTALEGIRFDIKKVKGENWKITDIEVD